MAKRIALVLVFALGGCAFAQKHPAVTIGIVAGSVGFVTCGLAVEKLGTCSLVGLGAGVAIGGITGLVTTIFASNADELAEDDQDALRRVRGDGPPPGPYLPPEPNPLPQTALPDAGVVGDASGADSPGAP